MKRQNFEEVKRTLNEIESRETMIRELKDLIEDHGDLISLEFRAGRKLVYIPVAYTVLAQETAVRLHNILVAELNGLLEKLETL